MVSDADLVAEADIVGLLERERPDDGMLGEEGASAVGLSGRRWVVDPLDGTTNFLYGIPQWAVSVALDDAEGGLVGVVFDPVADELFGAERGGGAKLNRKRIRVREGAELSRALVGTGFGYDPAVRAEQAKVVEHVLPRIRDIRRAGAAALDLAWVAAGRLDGFFERGLKPWDRAAGELLVTEAGGAVADMTGEPRGLVAGSPELVAELAGLLDSVGG
jgi:myo-inositol-1(or 4)-monophosphatase